MLKFLGCGSMFEMENTSAYFVTSEHELVVIDCPNSTFCKLKNRPLLEYKDIYVLITNTRSEHINGLSLFIRFLLERINKKITVVAPSSEIAEKIQMILYIEGVELSWFELIIASELADKEWFEQAILTEDFPQLKGKFFGYQLCVDGQNCVYTGDTITLEPFIPYIKPGTHLYVGVSITGFLGHLKLEDAIPVFKELIKKNVEISLMQLDDPDMACKILDQNFISAREVEVIFSHNCEQ